MEMNDNMDMELTTEAAPIVESVIATTEKGNGGSILIGTVIGAAATSGAYLVYRLVKKGLAKKKDKQAIAAEAARMSEGNFMPAEAVITPITETKKK